ncbi:DUF4756 family protein [Salmonella enterica]|uniref:DUF4756 family protein n=1 Tax=Salmonella enterica TaxID=28901 RepID=A0A5V3YNM6_SALER|nr:DUF4756 family protein [Salmonella enterica]EAB9742135.1 DUF4756 family protein [Salmonella enterica subsp. diarizonae]EAW1164441.1 DUF4756 family protein [Salmonella enterica subsp. enterica]EBE3719071.1 DUF4756 family protein [Salmonella enterica subsp. diarizonae serovar 42:l,v:1,5,7]ECH9564020.1 DUF4756 family protein [Salmonella enterica subsp. salamae]EDS4951326.1 DUF4756 family protein [Salmonella enterica subsp. enterica serovar Redlands]EDX2476190.1 DUF4756 family protein [Salmone
MRKVKLDNSDLIQYLDTIKELKNHISIEEYRNEYRKLRSDNIPLIKAQKFKSAHTELRRLDRKKESLLDKFIDELNPVNQASAFASKNIDKLETYSLYRRSLLEKSDDEIVSLVIKQRTEAAVKFQRSIEQSLEQLSHISSEFEPSSQKRRKMSL